jgi:hypothetical protein
MADNDNNNDTVGQPNTDQIQNLNAALKEARGEKQAYKEQLEAERKTNQELTGFLGVVAQGGETGQNALKNAWPETWSSVPGVPAAQPTAPASPPSTPPPAPPVVAKLDPQAEQRLNSATAYITAKQAEEKRMADATAREAWLTEHIYAPLEKKGITDEASRQMAVERLAGKYALAGKTVTNEEVLTMATDIVNGIDPEAVARAARQAQLGRVTEPKGFVGTPPSDAGSSSGAHTEDPYADASSPDALEKAFADDMAREKEAMRQEGVNLNQPIIG